ncbi:unnamed protein product (macronuclear) [Paramecium tetraurelia]|uniref:Uncharacterized protein n=1 Tax=Paramecium tetraurelia TaxID=5888 RepID=A0CS07_PARTE|nr:uncharacterized protein GSPATT00038925001 [Paramecium tetraurelia]CAK73574.1 unnamed protein product [Paramecium tetraurelia]|eukprot:XP_001440971.1 hypothetical protein (macronuclear) [Paramecium tetraurelia strain d4-2]
MNCLIEQVDDFYGVLAKSREVDDVVFQVLLKIFKREKIKDCLVFLSQDQNLRQVAQEILQLENSSLLGKEQLQVRKNNIKRITDILNNVKDHDINQQTYSLKDKEEIQKELIIKIQWEKKIIIFLRFLVHLTAFDERYIQCGSNSFHLLVYMKNSNTSLIGANLIRCDLSGSEFENIIISGMNLNQAKLFNCKWRNIGIDEEIMLYGHGDQVNKVCFSPNGKSLASCSSDNSIKLWDFKTGKIKSFLFGESELKSVSFSQNSTTLASCSGTFVYLRNLKTGKQISKLIGHIDIINSVCFSPNGTTLASGSDDNCIRLWDVKRGEQKARLDGHSDGILAVCFSHDGNTLASGSNDNSICLWNVKTAQKMLELEGHEDCVNTVCFSPDGTTLASGSYDKSIRLWDVKTGQLILKFKGLEDSVNTVCFSPDGTTLTSGSSDHSIRLWDVKTGQQKFELEGHEDCINSVCFSPDGTTLASGSYDKSIYVYGMLRQDYKKQNQMVIRVVLIRSVTPLMVLHQHPVVMITLSVSGILRQDKNKPNQKVMQAGQIQFASPLMVLHQHLVVMINLSVYGMQSQANIKPNLIVNLFYKMLILIIQYSEYVKIQLWKLQGALILKGEFVNYSGVNLKQLFKSKGSLILNNYKEQKQN